MIRAFVVVLSLLAGLAHAQHVRVGPFLQDAEPDRIWVVWETTGDAPSIVRYGPDQSTAMTAEGESIPGHEGSRIHHVELGGLEPDTPYFYRLDVEGERGEVFRFRTPPTRESGKSFRFVVYSDTQAGPDSSKHTEVINDGVIRFITEHFGPELSDELAFSLIPGDLVDQGSIYAQWKEQFFDEEQNLARHIPIYPVPGNHEQDAHWFFDYFHLPENGSPDFLEHWWYKDYANVRVIGLDSNGAYRIEEQLRWLDDVLEMAEKDPAIDFVFAQMHHPHKTPAWTPGETPYVGRIVRKLEEFSDRTGKPSIHFFGHTHAYERGQSRDHHHLWVDVSAAEGDLAWWGEYPRIDHPEFQKVFMDWGFVLMEVQDGDNPSFRLRRISRGNQFDPKDNEVIDDITIRHHNAAPFPPRIISPHNAPEADADGVRLVASAFRDRDGDTHLASHFQVTTVKGDYATPIVDEWFRFENWFAPEDAEGRATGYYSVDTRAGMDPTEHTTGLLEPLTTYHWRVRYRDSALAWSDWSTEGTFTTGAANVGACCLPEGDCDILRRLACLESGGVWLGTGSSCDDCPDIIAVWSEDFETVPLRDAVDEPAATGVWSPDPPAGWKTDPSAMPAGGVTEWRGWAIAGKTFWIDVSGDQGRSMFTRGTGAVAIADPDEWHDAEKGEGRFDASITTDAVPLDALKPGTSVLAFDSTWMPHADMTATVTVRYDTGEQATVLTWSSAPGTDQKPAAQDERVRVALNHPHDASSAVITFRLSNAGNDWYWAIDNLVVAGEAR